ncbi:MAG: hypothetical protein O6834_07980 [Actinobacteria bacterium]|nr:hypothetical protein [Actinomycetota bacterium]MCZ6738180.1 hypothetical protein [Actinomycetota bacterium]
MKSEPTDEATQKTQPRPRKKGKKMPDPFDIPVPSKDQIMGDFEKIVVPRPDADNNGE